MRARLVLTTALVAGLAVCASSAQAATPALDGKKSKALTFTDNGGAQANDVWTVTDLPGLAGQGGAVPAQLRRAQAEDCKAPACGVHPFLYKPAKGVAGGLMITTTWSNPVSDADLTLVQVEKDGSRTKVASCGFTGEPHEKVYVGRDALKAGRTYAVVVVFYRSVNETFTTKAEINVPSTLASTTGQRFVDCGL